MLSTLFALWAIAVVVPAVLLAVVVLTQATLGQLRRLPAASRPDAVGAAAKV